MQRKNKTCINITCGNKLPDNYLKKQDRHYKYRFCPKCNNNKGQLTLRWKCLGCNCVIYDGMVGRYFCKVNCKGRLSLKREQERQRQSIIRVAKKHIKLRVP